MLIEFQQYFRLASIDVYVEMYKPLFGADNASANTQTNKIKIGIPFIAVKVLQTSKNFLLTFW